MRRALLLLIIALLPLRAWVGDAMALSHPAGAPRAQVAAVAPPCHGAAATDHAGGMSASAHGMAADAASGDAGPVAHTCSACDVCHSSALASLPAPSLAAPAPRSLPVRAIARFASAERRNEDKPPIA